MRQLYGSDDFRFPTGRGIEARHSRRAGSRTVGAARRGRGQNSKDRQGFRAGVRSYGTVLPISRGTAKQVAIVKPPKRPDAAPDKARASRIGRPTSYTGQMSGAPPRVLLV